MKHKKTTPLSKFIFISTVILTLFTACEKISFEEYALIEYDGDLTWEEVTHKAEWQKRYDHDAVVFKNKLWVIGGYNPGMVNGDTYFEDVWSSSDGKNWDLILDDAPWLGRRGHALVVIEEGGQESMLLIGGFSVNEETGYRQYNNDVWKTNNGLNWEQIKERTYPDLSDSLDWMPRMHHKCVVANHGGVDYIYLIGGQTMLEGHSGVYSMEYFNDVWRSTDGIAWEKLLNNDYGIRSEHAATVSPDGKIFVQGGMHGVIFEAEDNATHPLPDWQYLWSTTDGVNWTSEINDKIISGNSFWRAGHEMVYYKDRIWTLPGKTVSNVHYHFANYSHYYSTWTYDESGDWNLDSEGTAIDARHSYSAVVFDDKIWVLGGFTNRNAQANDVWAAKL